MIEYNVALFLILLGLVNAFSSLDIWMAPDVNGNRHGGGNPRCMENDPCDTFERVIAVVDKQTNPVDVITIHMNSGLYRSPQFDKGHSVLSLRARMLVSFATIPGGGNFSSDAAEFPSLEEFSINVDAPHVSITNIDWSLGSPKWNVSNCEDLKVFGSLFTHATAAFAGDAVFTVQPREDQRGVFALFSNSIWSLSGQQMIRLPAYSNLTIDGGSQLTSPGTVASSVSPLSTPLQLFSLGNSILNGLWNHMASAEHVSVHSVYFDLVTATSVDAPMFRYTQLAEFNSCDFSEFTSLSPFLVGTGHLKLHRCVFEDVLSTIVHSEGQLDVQETSFVLGVNVTLILNQAILWWSRTVDLATEARIYVGCEGKLASQVMFESDSNSNNVNVDCATCKIADASVVDPCPDDFEGGGFWNAQSISVVVIGAALLITIVICLIAFFRYFSHHDKVVYSEVTTDVESGNISGSGAGLSTFI